MLRRSRPAARLRGGAGAQSEPNLDPNPAPNPALRDGGGAAERERLILAYLPQVRLLARRIQERLPESVALDDLVSAGVLGLIAAVDHFDPSRNIQLKTYAEYKIRGAILDSLRGLDWAPRLKRKKAKRIEAAVAAAEQRLLRAPREDEIAAELHLSLPEYHAWIVETRGLQAPWECAAGRRDPLQNVAARDDQQPANLFERAERERLLAGIIRGIPAIERTVLALYYRDELTLRDIARIFGLHESRISQLKSRAIGHIRREVAKYWPGPGGG